MNVIDYCWIPYNILNSSHYVLLKNIKYKQNIYNQLGSDVQCKRKRSINPFNITTKSKIEKHI